MIVYKKLICPSTYTWEFKLHPTTNFSKITFTFQAKQKKTYTSTHNETRGAVCIPASSYCACMYKSLNCPFCISIFIPRPRGCSILTQKNLFVKKFLHVFFVYCEADFNLRKVNATGISDGVYGYFLQ